MTFEEALERLRAAEARAKQAQQKIDRQRRQY
ncbi:hypothetical protein BH09PAT3_BH09PAT3_3960 [soil metagenome]